MSKDFINLIDSFNLMQSVTGPTHEKGHTLDLILSYGLDVAVSEICDTGMSDHLPIVFTIVVPCPDTLNVAPTVCVLLTL